MSTFSAREWLGFALKHADMRQTELARRLREATGDTKWVPQTVNKVLLGHRDMRADELLTIAAITGFSVQPHVVRLRVKAISIPFRQPEASAA